MNRVSEIKQRLAEIEREEDKLSAESNALEIELATLTIPFGIGDRIRERQPTNYATKRAMKTYKIEAFIDSETLRARSVRKDGSCGVTRRLWCYGDWNSKYEKVSGRPRND